MAYAVLVPERFRGGCPFGVIVVGGNRDELSRGPYWLPTAYRDLCSAAGMLADVPIIWSARVSAPE
jgi:hypothetical protein